MATVRVEVNNDFRKCMFSVSHQLPVTVSWDLNTLNIHQIQLQCCCMLFQYYDVVLKSSFLERGEKKMLHEHFEKGWVDMGNAAQRKWYPVYYLTDLPLPVNSNGWDVSLATIGYCDCVLTVLLVLVLRDGGWGHLCCGTLLSTSWVRSLREDSCPRWDRLDRLQCRVSSPGSKPSSPPPPC